MTFCIFFSNRDEDFGECFGAGAELVLLYWWQISWFGLSPTISGGESGLNILIESESYGLSFSWEHSNNSSSLGLQLAL